MARLDVDRELLAALDDALGASNTDKLLAMVPPDWTQLATKQDLTVLGVELRGEMTELRAELKTDMAELRTDMAELRAELKTDIAELRADVKITLHKELQRQTYFIVASLVAVIGAVLGSRAFG